MPSDRRQHALDEQHDRNRGRRDRLEECRSDAGEGKQAASASVLEPGSVSGQDIHEALEQFLLDNKNVSLPYGGTEGYWNCFVHQIRQIGFDIVKKPND